MGGPSFEFDFEIGHPKIFCGYPQPVQTDSGTET